MLTLDETKLRSCSVRSEAVKGLSAGFLEMLTDPEDNKKTDNKKTDKSEKKIDKKEVKAKPEFIVKNMSFDEQQRAYEDASLSLRLLKTDLPTEKSGNDITDALMLLVKTCKEQNKELTHETLYRLSLIKYGTVSPTISHTGAVLISTHFGIDFRVITEKILELTQMGSSFPKKK